MQTQVKRYSVTIRGKVQHIGYRGIIEGTGRKLDLKGYVFNDVDNFLSTLKDFARADIESIEKKEIHEDFPLPHLFSRVATDEYYEFSRKFDIGLDYLDGIKTDTGGIKVTLGDMKGTLGDMKESLTNINTTLESFVIKQDTHNRWMKDHLVKMDEHNQHIEEHNKRLEKILEKLAER